MSKMEGTNHKATMTMKDANLSRLPLGREEKPLIKGDPE